MHYQILTGTATELVKKVQSALDNRGGWILSGPPFRTGNTILITACPDSYTNELAQAMYQLTVVTPNEKETKS